MKISFIQNKKKLQTKKWGKENIQGGRIELIKSQWKYHHRSTACQDATTSPMTVTLTKSSHREMPTLHLHTRSTVALLPLIQLGTLLPGLYTYTSAIHSVWFCTYTHTTHFLLKFSHSAIIFLIVSVFFMFSFPLFYELIFVNFLYSLNKSAITSQDFT